MPKPLDNRPPLRSDMEKIESAFRERARALSPSRNSASTKASLNSIFQKVNDEKKVCSSQIYTVVCGYFMCQLSPLYSSMLPQDISSNNCRN